MISLVLLDMITNELWYSHTNEVTTVNNAARLAADFELTKHGIELSVAIKYVMSWNSLFSN